MWTFTDVSTLNREAELAACSRSLQGYLFWLDVQTAAEEYCLLWNKSEVLSHQTVTSVVDRNMIRRSNPRLISSVT